MSDEIIQIQISTEAITAGYLIAKLGLTPAGILTALQNEGEHDDLDSDERLAEINASPGILLTLNEIAKVVEYSNKSVNYV